MAYEPIEQGMIDDLNRVMGKSDSGTLARSYDRSYQELVPDPNVDEYNKSVGSMNAQEETLRQAYQQYALDYFNKMNQANNQTPGGIPNFRMNGQGGFEDAPYSRRIGDRAMLGGGPAAIKLKDDPADKLGKFIDMDFEMFKPEKQQTIWHKDTANDRIGKRNNAGSGSGKNKGIKPSLTWDDGSGKRQTIDIYSPPSTIPNTFLASVSDADMKYNYGTDPKFKIGNEQVTWQQTPQKVMNDVLSFYEDRGGVLDASAAPALQALMQKWGISSTNPSEIENVAALVKGIGTAASGMFQKNNNGTWTSNWATGNTPPYDTSIKGMQHYTVQVKYNNPQAENPTQYVSYQVPVYTDGSKGQKWDKKAGSAEWSVPAYDSSLMRKYIEEQLKTVGIDGQSIEYRLLPAEERTEGIFSNMKTLMSNIAMEQGIHNQTRVNVDDDYKQSLNEVVAASSMRYLSTFLFGKQKGK